MNPLFSNRKIKLHFDHLAAGRNCVPGTDRSTVSCRIRVRELVAMGFSMLFLVVAVAVLATTVTGLLSPDANSPQAFLAPHNEARRSVGVPALQWSTSLAAYALKYANSQRGRCLPLTHSSGPYGENLFWGSGKAWTPREAVTFWVQEQKYFRYATNKCQSGQMCGHYTQVVWKTTTQVGCASVQCSDQSVFIICSYNPPGNWIGQRPY